MSDEDEVTPATPVGQGDESSIHIYAWTCPIYGRSNQFLYRGDGAEAAAAINLKSHI